MSSEALKYYKGEPAPFPVPFPYIHHDEDETNFYRESTEIDRSFYQYCLGFGIDLSRFEGARTLNIGAGYHARFANEAKAYGLDVVSVNPNWQYVEKRVPDHTGQPWQGDGMSVAATAQHLPFTDGSFDLILSLWGVPAYLPGTVSEYRQAFTEIDRVMNDGAIALFYPLHWDLVAQKEFTDILDDTVGAHTILTGGNYPKLFIAKHVYPEDMDIIEDLLSHLDKPSEAYVHCLNPPDMGTKPQ